MTASLVTPSWAIRRGIPHPKRLQTRSLRARATQDPLGDGDANDGVYKAVMGIAALGSAETLYLTMSKFLHAPLVCLSSGCDSVINSPYSEVYGIPVSLLGLFGYGSVGLFAWECLSSKPVGISKTLLVSGTSLMASCTAVLLYTLLTKLNGEFCSWCYLSAALSFAMFGLSLTAVQREERMGVLMPSSGMALITALALLSVFRGIDDSAIANDIVIAYSNPAVTTESNGETVSLAKRLRASGKQSFGRQAMEYFPYVECYPNGYRKGVKVAQECEDAEIQGYPTWVFGAKQIPGEQSIESLEQELASLDQPQ